MTTGNRNPARHDTLSAAANASSVGSAAQATLVNRTHRVVRERARTQSARRRHLKSLSIPLAVFSALLIIISTGVWTVLAQNDLSPTGIPDASDQMLVFLLWFFPVSAVILAMVWSKRTQTPSGNEFMQ